jgi:tRNA-splicing ligase RtcB
MTKKIAIITGAAGITPAVLNQIVRENSQGNEVLVKASDGKIVGASPDYAILDDAATRDISGTKLRVHTHSVENKRNGALIFDWTGNIPVEDSARKQIGEVSMLPFVSRVAVMPDCHYGMGATIGTVIETQGALIPAAVGVDIGCGITALATAFHRSDFVGREEQIRHLLQVKIPNGRTENGGAGDLGKWGVTYPMPQEVLDALEGPNGLVAKYDALIERFERHGVPTKAVAHPYVKEHLGTLGTGNHFIELAADEEERVWILLHSGSRGPGAKLANWAMKRSREIAEQYFIDLPNKDLAYFVEGTVEFDLYKASLDWAVEYAETNRWLMTNMVAALVDRTLGYSPSTYDRSDWVNTSHNFVEKVRGKWITRKGASKAVRGQLSVMPGSMGARSYIVEGKANDKSLFSCSHGAGRAMSRTQALKTFTLEDLAEQTKGVWCRKDEGVLDETRDAYKNIDQVLAQQDELVEVRHMLSAFINVKG